MGAARLIPLATGGEAGEAVRMLPPEERDALKVQYGLLSVQ